MARRYRASGAGGKQGWFGEKRWSHHLASLTQRRTLHIRRVKMEIRRCVINGYCSSIVIKLPVICIKATANPCPQESMLRAPERLLLPSHPALVSQSRTRRRRRRASIAVRHHTRTFTYPPSCSCTPSYGYRNRCNPSCHHLCLCSTPRLCSTCSTSTSPCSGRTCHVPSSTDRNPP